MTRAVLLNAPGPPGPVGPQGPRGPIGPSGQIPAVYVADKGYVADAKLVGGAWIGTDNTAAIQKALSSLDGLIGGTIIFPPGPGIFSGQLNFGVNVTIVGQGSRYMQDFNTSAPTKLIYTGSGTTSPIHLQGNYVRNFYAKDIEICYGSSSFTGSLIYVDTTAAITFSRCALGGAAEGSGYLSSAEAVVKVVGTERLKLDQCILQQATRGVWAPNTGLLCSGLTVKDCQLDNVTRAHIEIESGSSLAVSIHNNLFDNTSLVNPTYGLICEASGFCVEDNTFAGSTALSTPTGEYVLLGGYGRFSGNVLLTNNPGIVCKVGGTYEISGNYGQGSPPLTILGGIVKGGGNTWQPTQTSGTATISYDRGVYLDVGSSLSCLDIGPDSFLALAPAGSYTGSSYDLVVSGGVYGDVCGEIKYSPNFDQSTSGPIGAVSSVVFRNMRLQAFTENDLPKGNIGAGSDTLCGVFVLPKNSLSVAGKGFRADAFGKTSNDTHAKQVKIYFGGVLLYDSGVVVSTNEPWSASIVLFRVDSSNQECFLDAVFHGTRTLLHVSTTADLSADQNLTVYCTGDTASNDCVLQGFKVKPT